MSLKAWLDVAILVSAFFCGVAMVHRYYRTRAPRMAARSQANVGSPPTAPLMIQRPQGQIEVRGFDGLVDSTATRELLGAIERRMRLSSSTFERDCVPVLEAFAEFVQMLPASECHHHAQPGGLWIHALEVVDAALTFRAGMEVPTGASTEDRKKQEHRWTYAVFAAALLHDVGKPVTDVKVLVYGQDPRAGRTWAPMAGSIKTFGASWYSVAFADPGDRDYKAHTKLPGMLMHAFVPARVMRWLAEEGDVLAQLMAYLSGDDPDGTLGAIVKRADSDSVRRNLLTGSRTRFSSARTRPLIERLMEALRRMLHEGGSLPLNRPGAAGWVHEGRLWFVCARLAEEVRTYLAQHESSAAVPGKDRNDRLFDTWQEHGAVVPAPDGGAVWRVRVECDNWSPPDALTVLCFPLEKLYADPKQYPAPMRGRVWSATTLGGPSAGASIASTSSSASVAAPAADLPVSPARPAAPASAVAQAPSAAVTAELTATGTSVQGTAATVSSSIRPPDATSRHEAPAPTPSPGPAAGAASQISLAQAHNSMTGAVQLSADPLPQSHGDDDRLSPAESAGAELAEDRVTTTPELGAPLRPKERHQRPPGSAAIKGPSAAATAFMAWVANGVGSGAVKYNEDGAPVHFVREGALLLSPEIFRRFLSEHEAVLDGPIAALRQVHGDKAFARLQNELAKSGWTVRNGDENLHHYAFVKADKQLSRVASFFLVGKPELFWNPVPPANDRIRQAPRVRKMELPAGVGKGDGGRDSKAARSPA